MTETTMPLFEAMEDLGFDREILDVLESDRNNSNGMVIVGSLAGQGKTSTVANLIEQYALAQEGSVDVLVIGEPCRHFSSFSNALQIPFEGIRGESNTNVNCCVVSEIRDVSTAKAARDMLSKNCKVYATIRSASVNQIMFHLKNMGWSNAGSADFQHVGTLLNQCLVPILCEHCSSPANSEEMSDVSALFGFEFTGNLMVRNHEGCSKCNAEGLGGGYTHWKAVGEVIIPDNGYLQFVAANNQSGAMRHWLKSVSKGGLGGATIGKKLERLIKFGALDINDAIHAGLQPFSNILEVSR